MVPDKEPIGWFVKAPSFAPKLAPLFNYVDAGDAFRKQSLENGLRLTADTTPSLTEVPTAARLETRHRLLPDFFHIGGAPTVESGVKDMIESLEPGVHQFFPIELWRTKSERFAGDYYLLNITTLLDALIMEKSNVEIRFSEAGKSYYRVIRGDNDYRTVRGDIVKGRHLWRCRRMQRELYFSSDLKCKIFEGRSLSFDKFYKIYADYHSGVLII